MSLFFRWITMPYYAVRRGRIPGIYKTWDECKKQVNGFPKARYKKFNSETEANDFVNDTESEPGHCSSTKVYNTQPQNRYHKSTATNNMGHTPAASSHRQPVQKVSVSNNTDGFNDAEFNGDMKNVFKIEYKKTVYMQNPRSGDTNQRSNGAKSRGVHSKPSSTWSRSFHTRNRNENDTGQDNGVVVYTDGGCFNNGQRGAQAGIGVYWGPDDPRNVSERLPGRQTNNRAEIHAACRAIEQAKTQGLQSITIKTDSQFLISAATQWMPGWLSNNWKLSSGGPVKNKEDFVHLNQVSAGIRIKWIHVPGHRGIVGNEAADSLANEGALKPLP
ncbi:ribonuclease H1-like [Ylistrum balloti]|uniref:ribonuclease H1-like n=1 Tax=Ylistrum balloti TaxID=509963 RepID=UPI002905DA81|nr:ribonuclease H1-like [Ylistrum balloti]